MPVLRKPISIPKVETGNSAIDALINFLGINDMADPSALVDFGNPVMGMARRSASGILRQLRREVSPLEYGVYREAARNKNVPIDEVRNFIHQSRQRATGKDRINDLELHELQQYKKQLDDLHEMQRSDAVWNAKRGRWRREVVTDPNILAARKALRRLMD